MQNRFVELISALALASVMASGCGGSGDPSGTGGSGSGGSGGTGGTAGGCPSGTACGGDLTGTWKVTSSCLNISGTIDGDLASLGCKTVPVTGSATVEGTWIADGKGAYTDNTTTTASISFALADACLTISGAKAECSRIGSTFDSIGWKKTTCSTNASGKCVCTGSVKQEGGIGFVSGFAQTSGDYTTSGNDLTTDGSVDYTYCVAGDKLTLIPKQTLSPVTGTIVLQKQSGTGGQGGGTGGKGGSTGGSSGGTSTGGTATGGSGGRGGSGGTATGGSGGVASGGSGGTSTGGAVANLPCDIYGAAKNTCVAAHSTVRALFAAYSGNLYRVKRKSDGTFKDIPVLSPGGVADSKVQDDFCANTTCTITRVYDQSGKGNYLEAETLDAEDPSARPDPNQPAGARESAANATKERLAVGGHNVYSLYMAPRQAYWRNGSTSGIPTGSNPQGIYMVTSGTHINDQCCFDYGNGPLKRQVAGGGTMDAIYFGTDTMWGKGNGAGPWVMADFEGGLFAQSDRGQNDKDMSLPFPYVTAVEKCDGTSEFAIRGGDATQGNLSTFFKGNLPYAKIEKQGAIVLGSGGDCCYSNNNASEGTFYEGAIVTGYPSDATEDAVQKNIVSAGYGK